MQIVKQRTKTLVTRDNSRSSDAISPNYVYGCGGGCFSYCYVSRNNKTKVFINKNSDKIFNSVSNWAKDKEFPKVPNQQHDKYYIIDIGCSSDLSLYQKHIDLYSILKQYDEHPKLTSTFATKYSHMLNLDVRGFNKKPRVRISMMPEELSKVLEPNTTTITQRILDIDRLQDLGWEVHINFSPVVVVPSALNLYRELFDSIDNMVTNQKEVKSEVIFLTHNANKHVYNVDYEIQGENLLWRPELQEYKTSEYGGGNLRYKWQLKKKLIADFKKIHSEIIPWAEIRYIF